jgi:hypothetical protein
MPPDQPAGPAGPATSLALDTPFAPDAFVAPAGPVAPDLPVAPIGRLPPVPESATVIALGALLLIVSVAELGPVACGANRTSIVQVVITGDPHPLLTM